MPFQPNRRVLLTLTGVVLLGIATVFIAVTVGGWKETTAHARQTNANVAGTLAANIQQILDTYDRSLQGSALEAQDPVIMALPADIRAKVVFDKAVDVPGVSEFAVFDASGDLVMSSLAARKKLNVADRSYFKTLRDRPEAGLLIDGPLTLRQTGALAVVLSRRRTDTSGKFAGVVTATIRLQFFDNLFDRVLLNPGSQISLMGTDMRVIARLPHQPGLIGRSLENATPVRRFKAGEKFFRETSSLNGVTQLYYFEPVAGYPMVISVSDPVSAIYANWRERTVWLGISTFLLMCANFALVGLFLQELNGRRALTRRMQHLAHHDPLSGLPNRLLLLDRATQMLAQAGRDGREVAVMYLDLDGFKDVNDALGHAAGDELLQLVAHRLCSCLRKADTLSRQGGDEFVVLAPLTEGVEGARHVATKLVVQGQQPYVVGGQELRVTSSVGIALFPRDGLTFEVLAQRADAAMYQAKRAGRNRFVFYDDEIGRIAEQALQRGSEQHDEEPDNTSRAAN
jgi:diguanylate cyclase (GGDEF)-like protein